MATMGEQWASEDNNRTGAEIQVVMFQFLGWLHEIGPALQHIQTLLEVVTNWVVKICLPNPEIFWLDHF